MLDHNWDPYTKLLELEVDVLHIQQNQDELIRQHTNLSHTVEKITEQLRDMIIILQANQHQIDNLEQHIHEQESKE